jgi:hypothetical protein
VTIEAPGRVIVHREVEAQAGQNVPVALAFDEGAHTGQTPSHIRTRPIQSRTSNAVSPVKWVGFAVGAVGLVAAGTFEILAELRYQSLTSNCPLHCDQSDIDAGNAFEWGAGIAAGVAVVGAAIGVSALIGSAPRRTAAQSPRVVIGLRSIGLTTRF